LALRAVVVVAIVDDTGDTDNEDEDDNNTMFLQIMEEPTATLLGAKARPQEQSKEIIVTLRITTEEER